LIEVRVRIAHASYDSVTPLLVVSGDIDVWSAPTLFAAIRTELEANRNVVVDLSGVTFIESTGMSVLVAESREARERGAWLALRENPSDSVTQVLQSDPTGAARDRFRWVP
jgi:anti-anti-sigma factor